MNKIAFPCEVSGIEARHPKFNEDSWTGHKVGALVAVRPCGKEYNDKTYVGIYLGDLPIDVYVSRDPKTKKLLVGTFGNPGIFVPDLKKIIFGCGSWWGEIKSPEELRQITDDDIDNVWYVKALKAMAGAEEKKMNTVNRPAPLPGALQATTYSRGRKKKAKVKK